MRRVAVLSVLVFVLDCVHGRSLPSYLKACKRNDPNLHKCIMENVEILRPRLKKGVPELYIPSLDPLIIPEATLTSGGSFAATFRNIAMFHADEFKLEAFDLDLNKLRADIRITFPRLRIKSNYNIKGRLLVLNLDGSGPADGNYTNVQGLLSLKGERFQKSNKEYIKWEKEKIDIKIGKIHLQFEEIFGNNVELNAQTNRVINENIETIVEELKPVIQQLVTEFVFNVVNRLFGRYSISELFPSSK